MRIYIKNRSEPTGGTRKNLTASVIEHEKFHHFEFSGSVCQKPTLSDPANNKMEGGNRVRQEHILRSSGNL